MLAGALSGAMIGVGLGLAADTWGVATPFTFGLISGAIGAGFGSAACGGVLSGDCQINWAGFIQGAGIGAVAGFIGGYVGGAATAWTGASWLGGVAAAGIGGWYADVTWQAGGIASGLQETPYSFTQTVEVALTSASGAGVLQWAAQAMYRPAQIIPSTPTPSQFILGVSAEEAALLRAGVQQISGHVHSSVCGSRTPGAARPPSLQSDVDIIVVRQGGVPPATEATAIENALSQLVGPRVHLNFMTPEVYETLWRGAVNEYPIE